jgi:hypothetical protein
MNILLQKRQLARRVYDHVIPNYSVPWYHVGSWLPDALRDGLGETISQSAVLHYIEDDEIAGASFDKIH